MTDTQQAFDPRKDRAHRKKVGSVHFVGVLAALTLWGAADAWAVQSGWALAWAVALANAVVAARVVSSILHEWGHYAGARLAGARAPVRSWPVDYFFVFDFDFEHNDRDQFLAMSLGGILVPWLLVIGVALAIPIDNVSRALLFAGFATTAFQVTLFELPVVLRTRAGGDPRAELGRNFKASLRRSRNLGLAAGAVVWLATLAFAL